MESVIYSANNNIFGAVGCIRSWLHMALLTDLPLPRLFQDLIED